MEWLESFRDAHRGGYRPAGICLTCRKGSGCNGKRFKNTCPDHISKDLTREEWADNYRNRLRKMMEKHKGIEESRAFGNASACRRAMLQLHGYTETQLREIEDGIPELETPEGRYRLKRLRWEL